MGWHVGDDSRHCRAGFALSRWRLAGDGRKYTEHGADHLCDWLWTLSQCIGGQPHVEADWSALFTALQLWLSGTSQLQVVIPAMLLVHAFIGLGEAVITIAALSFVLQARPDLLGDNSESAKGSKGWIIAGVAISLVVIFLSPLASTDPDGLNRVAMNLGFIPSAQARVGPLAGYTIPFLVNASASKIAAGVIGAIGAGYLCWAHFAEKITI